MSQCLHIPASVDAKPGTAPYDHQERYPPDKIAGEKTGDGVKQDKLTDTSNWELAILFIFAPYSE